MMGQHQFASPRPRLSPYVLPLHLQVRDAGPALRPVHVVFSPTALTSVVDYLLFFVPAHAYEPDIALPSKDLRLRPGRSSFRKRRQSASALALLGWYLMVPPVS